MRKSLSIGLVLVLAFALNLQAQGERGTIRGTVLDPTGAAVPGATVTVTNTTTGVALSTTTSGSGLYNVANLRPETYVVAVELSGFKRAVQDGVEVNVAAVVGLDFTLELGAVAESVEVTAAAPQLRTETTEIGTVIPQVVLTDLPLAVGGGGRSPLQFIFLTPGASSGGTSAPDGSSSSQIGSTFFQRMNGGQVFSMEMNLDGLSMQAGVWVNTGRELSFAPEAIQEASMAEGTSTAETSSGGGMARFTTRSGTNEFHGNLYEFWRNDYFDASGFFNATPPKVRWNEFGFSIGGPIVKDKAFFFLNQNWFRRKDAGGSDFLSVPTAAVKSGDLSSLLGAEIAPGVRENQIYDPLTTRTVGTDIIRDPFPGNIIPSDRISPISRSINGFLASPTSAGEFNNFLSVSQPRQQFYKNTFRIDYRVTQSHSVFFMSNLSPRNAMDISAIPFPHGQNRTGGSHNRNIRTAWDYVISPTVTNHFAGGFNQNPETYFIVGDGEGWSEILGFGRRGEQGQAPFTGLHDGAFPDITFGAGSYSRISGSGGSIDTNTKFFQNIWVFGDTLTVLRGKHNIKIGMDYRTIHVDQFSAPSNGRFTFERTQSGQPGLAATGHSWGSFLLGDVNTAGLLDPAFNPGGLSKSRVNMLGLYFQDDIKITPTFTLNLGLRWDAFTPMRDTNDNWSVLDLNLANPGAGGRPGALVFAGQGAGRIGKSRVPGADKVDMTNFAPRIGIAWRFAPSTVLRVGYGVHYFGTMIHMAGNLRRSGLGFEALPSFISPDAGLSPAYNWSDPANLGFPNYARPPLIDPAFANGSRAWEFHDTDKIPYRQEWSFNVQHQLPGNWLIDVAYVGNKGTRLTSGVFNQNQLNPSFLGLGSDLGLSFQDDAAAIGALGFSPPYAGFEGTLGQSLRPFPQYSLVGTVGDIGGDSIDAVGIGNSTFHSFQAKVERRLTEGLYLLSSFRWSKMITDSDSNWGAFWSPRSRDFYNRQLEKALAPSDIAARWVTAFMYELPFGPGKLLGGGTTGATAKVLGGWQLTGALTYQTGNPIQVIAPNAVGLFTRRQLPNVVSGIDQHGISSGFDPGIGLDEQARDKFLNASAFTNPEPFTFGNGPSVTGVRTFPFYQENVGLIKRTSVTERVNVEWRIEFFNVLNRVRFGNPSIDIGNATTFGTIGGPGNSARQGQMALKINF